MYALGDIFLPAGALIRQIWAVSTFPHSECYQAAAILGQLMASGSPLKGARKKRDAPRRLQVSRSGALQARP